MDSNNYNEKVRYGNVVSALTTYSPRIFSIHGRLGRLRFIGYQMLTAFLVLLSYLLLVELGNAVIMPEDPAENSVLLITLGGGLVAVLLGAYFIYAKRRLNDMNRVGWWALLSLIPGVNVLFHLYLMFAEGNNGANDYGPSAKDNPRFMWIVGLLPVVVTGLLFGTAVVFLLGLEKYAQMNSMLQFHQ